MCICKNEGPNRVVHLYLFIELTPGVTIQAWKRHLLSFAIMLPRSINPQSISILDVYFIFGDGLKRPGI